MRRHGIVGERARAGGGAAAAEAGTGAGAAMTHYGRDCPGRP